MDVYHYFGTDLSVDATGDILSVDGVEEGQQAVIRRLLTNAGDDIFNVAYGAGLGQFVGQPVQESKITGIVRSNMYKEAVVQQNPPPSVEIVSDNSGVVELNVKYTDATNGKNYLLNLPLGEN